MSNMIKISPSILAADFSQLGEEVARIERAGADYIHIDVMDGHFVPNITIGPCVINSIRHTSKAPFDVHLMIENPERYVEDFAKAGADIITVHAEASIHLDRLIQQIHDLGKKAGVSLVPSTPAHVLDYVIDQLDLVLVMTVNPGFGGQKFLDSQLSKIAQIRTMIDQTGSSIDLEVDGGINKDTAKKVIAAGADTLVAGTAVFGGSPEEYARNIQQLRA